jgi:hypothetical protein
VWRRDGGRGGSRFVVGDGRYDAAEGLLHVSVAMASPCPRLTAIDVVSRAQAARESSDDVGGCC